MKIGIYGLGRFGAFWASTLAPSFEVVAYNRSPGRPEPQGVKLVDLEGLVEADVLFLCTSISSFEVVVRSLKNHLRPGTLVMDTCSVKAYPAAVMQREFSRDIELIATHPMFGPDSGKDGVDGLPLVFSPLRCSVERSLWWKEQFRSMGLKVLEMSCLEHDKEAAYSQGVTHFVGRLLRELDLQETELATVGYQRLLSIIEQTCNDPLQLFLDLQRYNPFAFKMHQELKKALDSITQLLDQQDDQAWLELCES